MTLALLALNLALAVGVLVRRLTARRGVELEHVTLFAFGFLYYWMLPVVAGVSPSLGDSVAERVWRSLFDALPTSALTWYLATSAVFFAAFWLGAVAYRAAFRHAPDAPHLPFERRLLNLLFVPVLLLSAALAYDLRGEFLGGYGAESAFQSGSRGSLLATSLLLLSFVLLYDGARRGRDDGAPSRGGLLRVFANRWGALYLTLSFALLTLGGRITFVTGVVAVLVYWSTYVRAISRGTLLAGTAVSILFVGVIGAVRFGLLAGALSPEVIAFGLVAEPVFTSFSLMNFLAAGRFELLNAPWPLASGLINVVPSFVLPNKVELMVDPAQLGYSVESPFGALSSWVSFMINFGAVGTAVVLFVASAALEHLRRRDAPLARVTYPMICGFLAFSLFRDPFYHSIVKSILQLSVIMPIAVVVLLHVMTVVARRVPAGAPARG